MLLKLTCPACHLIGLANSETLPRSMTCSSCSTTSFIEQGERIRNAAFFQEWLTGSGDAELADTAGQ
jgi:hypothetical protein